MEMCMVQMDYKCTIIWKCECMIRIDYKYTKLTSPRLLEPLKMIMV